MRDFGKFLTGTCCCFFVIFMIIFIPLYLHGKSSLVKTKCEVLERSSENCVYKSCGGSNKRCTALQSTRYIFKYLIHEIDEGSCNKKNFTVYSKCKKPRRYEVGNKRTCYVNRNCNNESFNNDYLNTSWVMLGFACVSFAGYLIGMCMYHCDSY